MRPKCLLFLWQDCEICAINHDAELHRGNPQKNAEAWLGKKKTPWRPSLRWAKRLKKNVFKLLLQGSPCLWYIQHLQIQTQLIPLMVHLLRTLRRQTQALLPEATSRLPEQRRPERALSVPVPRFLHCILPMMMIVRLASHLLQINRCTDKQKAASCPRWYDWF